MFNSHVTQRLTRAAHFTTFSLSSIVWAEIEISFRFQTSKGDFDQYVTISTPKRLHLRSLPIVTCDTDYVGRVTERNEISLIFEPWPAHPLEVLDSLDHGTSLICIGALYLRTTGTTGVNYTATGIRSKVYIASFTDHDPKSGACMRITIIDLLIHLYQSALTSLYRISARPPLLFST